MRIIRSTRSLSSGAEKDGSVVLVGSTAVEGVAATEHTDADAAVNGLFRDAFFCMAPPDADEEEDVASQNSDRRERKLLDMAYYSLPTQALGRQIASWSGQVRTSKRWWWKVEVEGGPEGGGFLAGRGDAITRANSCMNS
jgi:hypothetical protein